MDIILAVILGSLFGFALHRDRRAGDAVRRHTCDSPGNGVAFLADEVGRSGLAARKGEVPAIAKRPGAAATNDDRL